MFSTVTSWLGVTKPDEVSPSGSPVRKNMDTEVIENNPENVPEKSEKGEMDTSSSGEKDDVTTQDNQSKEVTSDPTETTEEENKELTPEELQKQLDEVSQKAIQSAKEWGTYLYSFGKEATKQVAKVSVQAAKSVKEVVEDKTILGEFSKEQHKYIDDRREKERRAEAAVPPWIGYNEEEAMKSQILALSLDKRNFCRNPPAGVQFNFEFESVYPVALATLQEDPNLQKMRFELVPKQVKEAVFWRNYFYRVSLIKQSTQLTSLAQHTGTTGENSSKSSGSSRRSSIDGSQKDDSSEYDKLSDVNEAAGLRRPEKTPPMQIETRTSHLKDDADIAMGSSPADNDFVSDAFAESNITDEDLKKEMLQLGMDQETMATEENEAQVPGKNDDVQIEDWEKELMAEILEAEN